MSRRLLTAGLSVAVLLGAQSGFGRIAAKPPDLPIIDNDVLNIPLLVSEESDATAPNRIPIADAPTATPAMEIPMLFQLRPSVRRTMASCVLFGVHPLLALAPTEEFLDLDEDDWSSASPPALVKPAAKEDASSNCPYMRQQECAPDRHAVLFADPDFSRDVLQNLEALRQSRDLLEKARELGRAGRVGEALNTLVVAEVLCPGSRFDEEIKATSAEILSYALGGEHWMSQKLSQPVTLNFINAPLSQVIDDLRSGQWVNIYVDKAALDAEEISLDRSITIKLENVPLKSALSLILKEAHLTYIFKEDGVQITTEQAHGVGIQPSLPPVDSGVPTALDHLLYETLKVGLAAGGGSEEQEARVETQPQGSFEFGFGMDGGFRLFTQFQHGGDIWHLEFNQNGLKWWALPDGGAEVEPQDCTRFNLEDAQAP